MAVHIILNEAEQDVELIEGIKSSLEKTEALLEVNPRGQVPALFEGDSLMLEGGAMIIYLCDKYKLNLMPQSGWERAQALQWLMVCNASLHPAYSRTNFIKRNGGSAENVRMSRAGAQQIWDLVEENLSTQGPYLCGANPTAGDILLTVIANWADEGVYTYGDNTKALFKKIIARPAYQKALATEGVEYKAAA
jgi:glutathione S-transferase